MRGQAESEELFNKDGDMLDRYGYKIPEHLHEDYEEWVTSTKDASKRRGEEYAAILYTLAEPYFDVNAEELFKKGIPPAMRRCMYLQATGVGNVIAHNRGRYDEILSLRSGVEEESLSARNSIANDVTRTFRSNVWLSNERGETRLKNILTVYARYNRQVGYNQSMSYIVLGFLLLEFTDEEAFWMLDHVIREVLPDYFDAGMTGLLADIEVLDYYIRAKLPQLHSFFLRNFIEPQVYASPLFACMYVGYLPYETLFRMWDRIMFSGALELFRSALKFFFAIEASLLRTDHMDLDVIMKQLIQGHLNLFNSDFVLGRMPGKQELKPGHLRLRRMRVRERNRAKTEPPSADALHSSNPLARSNSAAMHRPSVFAKLPDLMSPSESSDEEGEDESDTPRPSAPASSSRVRSAPTVYTTSPRSPVDGKERR